MRAVEGRLVGGHLGLAGRDQAALLGQPALRLLTFGFAGGQGCPGALDGQFEIGPFQVNQELALGHMLVVLDQDVVDAGTELALRCA